MSDSRFRPVDDIETERQSVREPAKLWFNWWRARRLVTVEAANGCYVFHAGDEFRDHGWPSKEVAEQKSVDSWEVCGDAVEYLGALPAGEAP